MDGHLKKCLCGKMATDPSRTFRGNFGRFGEVGGIFFFVLNNSSDLPLASRGDAFFTGVFGKVGGVGFLNEFLNRNPILARKK